MARIRAEKANETFHDTARPRGPWIQTFSGIKFHLFDPAHEDITIEDISNGLALTTRYGGQCREFYSVAQHSVYVSQQVPQEHAMAALLHDAAEAYLGDLPRPLKHAVGMERFREAESVLEHMIDDVFDVDSHVPEVKLADSQLLATEKRDLLHRMQDDMGEEEWSHGAPVEDALPISILPLPPAQAKLLFINRYNELKRREQDGGW
jgi:5'-deoxynucleotidase YfbR-like HD superfamily hydrolase